MWTGVGCIVAAALARQGEYLNSAPAAVSWQGSRTSPAEVAGLGTAAVRETAVVVEAEPVGAFAVLDIVGLAESVVRVLALVLVLAWRVALRQTVARLPAVVQILQRTLIDGLLVASEVRDLPHELLGGFPGRSTQQRTGL